MDFYKDITFPVYRKYLNGQSWFRVNNAGSFEEIRRMGSKYLKSEHEVRILPERNFLHDLVFNYREFAEEISAEEYSTVAEKAE